MMDSKRFFSVANENYPLLRRPQSSPPQKTLLAGVNLLIGDMQTSTQMTLAREAAMTDWARLHTVRAPEHVTGVVLSYTI
jgi:phage protein D